MVQKRHAVARSYGVPFSGNIVPALCTCRREQRKAGLMRPFSACCHQHEGSLHVRECAPGAHVLYGWTSPNGNPHVQKSRIPASSFFSWSFHHLSSSRFHSSRPLSPHFPASERNPIWPFVLFLLHLPFPATPAFGHLVPLTYERATLIFRATCLCTRCYLWVAATFPSSPLSPDHSSSAWRQRCTLKRTRIATSAL